MDKVLIRKLKEEDADDIILIQAAITKSSIKDDFRKTVREHALKEEVTSFVAEFKGKVVGFMISHILSGGFGISKSAWIAMLGVNPEYMGQGIGDKLARKIMKYYRDKDIKEIYTSVRWDSVDLLSFFKTIGFDRSNFINLRKKLTDE